MVQTNGRFPSLCLCFKTRPFGKTFQMKINLIYMK